MRRVTVQEMSKYKKAWNNSLFIWEGLKCTTSDRKQTVPGGLVLAKYEKYKLIKLSLMGIYLQFVSNPGVI